MNFFVRSVMYQVLLLFCFSMQAQNKQELLYFNHLGIEDGLTQNTVWCIMQDKKGFMWFGTKDGLNRYDGNRFKTFRYDPQNPKTSLGNNFVRSFCEDANGIIWIGTSSGLYAYNSVIEQFKHFEKKTVGGVSITHEVNDIKLDRHGCLWIGVFSQGVFRYDQNRDELTHFQYISNDDTGLSSNDIWSIFIDRDEVVWIGSINGGLDKYEPSADRFKHFPDKHNNSTDSLNDIYQITEYDNKSLLLGTSDRGVLVFNRITEEITPLVTVNNGSSFFARTMLQIENKLWIGTESGLYVYDRMTNKTDIFEHNINDKYSLSSNAIYSIFKDMEGGIWVGSYFGGIDYLSPHNHVFNKYYPTSVSNNIPARAIREFHEDRQGNIWIGTEDAGLFHLDITSGKLNPFNKNRYHNIHGILLDGDSLWIGYFTRGMDLINLKTGSVKTFSSSSSSSSLSDNNVFSIYKDSYGNIWTGTIYGLNVIAYGTSDICKVKEPGNKTFIYDILEDRYGVLWFATWGDGVYSFNPRTNDWLNFRHRSNDPSTLASDRTIGLFEDSEGRMWVSTEGAGVSVFDAKKQKFDTYSTLNGLPNNVIYKVLQDDDGDYWLSSNKGLTRMSANAQRITTFTRNNGLLTDQFNYKSGLKTKNGKLYFGSINGFISFNPRDIKLNETVPPVTLTGFRLFNREIEYHINSSLKQSITTGEQFDLSHYDNTFTFEFAALSYIAPQMNSYAYRLEGFDLDWIYITGNGSATYSNIEPGKYRFCVKGANSDGVWNSDGVSIDLEIHPPFWSSRLGVILKCLLTGSVLFYIIHFYMKRRRNKNVMQHVMIEMENEKTIHKAKLDFFINIAHEIRTPLSLIKGPYEQICSKEMSVDYHENLDIMGNNISRLTSLVDQILDISKVENNKITLNLGLVNVNNLIESILFRFKPAFKNNDLELETCLPKEQVISMVDNELLTKILSNLINNACKFANRHIIIELIHKLSDNMYSIRISNDGQLIQPQNKELVFEAFFREENAKNISGTGIGLSLVRQLVNLHHGRVYIDDTVFNMNCFVVELPLLINEAPAAIEEENIENIVVENTAKSCILVVEDDPEMLKFLKRLLTKQYTVILATNGREALSILEKTSINLIVSDLMMPHMDGIEMCINVKNNIEHSHIPIILLTAMNSINSQIEGLNAGADIYIEKPFSTDILLIQIRNLLHNREISREAFLNNPETNSDSIANSEADEKFLKQVDEFILENIDTNLSIDFLADKIGMSRSSFYRKIKSIALLNPNEYIRLIRLKEASRLLKEGNYNVSEICYMVGFNAPSYFSKCFYQQFGMLPKEYIH